MAILWKDSRITPAQVIIAGFALLIAAGTLLLMLPVSTREAGGAPFLDALFTATSATCVTGLAVRDTAQYWSGFGQGVILALIQTGGMGVVTMALAVSIFAGRRIGLKQRWIMQESISAPQMGGIVRQTKFILHTAMCIELCGAALLAVRFLPQYGAQGLWMALFHSVSAFCNAGFDLMGPSLSGYVGDALVSLTIAALIILGGLGFLTWYDVRTHGFALHRYSLQSKVILAATALLLGGSFLYFICYEFRLPQWQSYPPGQRFLAAWFQAVTPRTAGFYTVDTAQLSPLSQLVTLLLMLTGGAPGSTAGGFKVTTLAVLVLGIAAMFRSRPAAQGFGRRIPEDIQRNAGVIFVLYLLLFLLGGMLLCALDAVPLSAALFESASAIGTVGLSLGITAQLGTASRCILIFLMYFGRVGCLTMVYALFPGRTACASSLPPEKLTVG